MSIRVEHLTHIYNKGLAYETRAVDDVSFAIGDSEFVGVIGHTGSGKSTLVQHLNGILKPDSGKIYIGDTDITAKETKMSDIRKKIGLVFQYPEYQLFDETVKKDVGYGPRNLRLTEADIDLRVREAMALVNMDYDQFAERSPFELSGGQKRRIAIAGVIAMKPEVLILDEPTAGLDPKAHADVLNMIETIRARTGNIVFLVSHNMGDIAAMTDRVLVLDKGKLVMNGSPAEVFRNTKILPEIGLGLPPATETANKLRARGMKIEGDILTLDALAKEIISGFGSAGFVGRQDFETPAAGLRGEAT